jgi:hypothetical protein
MGLPESILLIVFSLIFFCEETNARISAESNSNSAARFSAATEFYNATHSHQKQLLNFPPQLELLNHPPESPPAAAECPSGCACAQLTVICTGRRLTKVPSNIPPNAVRLDLQVILPENNYYSYVVSSYWII